MSSPLTIKELIVVEGVDDVSAVKKAVEAQVLPVHGFAVRSKKTLQRIKDASETIGVIVLTDPDHGGAQIRKTIEQAAPLAKHAYISREEGRKKDNIGVENASSEAICSALKKARCKLVEKRSEFNLNDMAYYGLCNEEGSKQLRQNLGRELRIGYGNTKQFLARLNHFGITKVELEKALLKLE